MSSHTISEDRLNAFVDDQLDASGKSEVFEALSHDSGLSRQACELRWLGELVRHAYREPPQSERLQKEKARYTNPFGRAAAASLLLGVGALLGWIGHQQPAVTPVKGPAMKAMVWENGDRAFHSYDLATAARHGELKRVILHLNTSSPAKFEKALDTAEKLLKKYANGDHGAQIEVVAKASAIKLLRKGYTPFAARVRALQEKYFNLTFLACKDAMDHIRELEGSKQEVKLLPGVEVTPSALDHILQRMNEGWVYLNV